jgi:PAS domain S-box-containing protein
LILLDYIVNLSIFSFLVSIPLVIRSLIKHRPINHIHLWGGIYGGIVSFILVMLSIQEQGYSYDIRYAPVILVYTFLGPVAGIITGVFALIARLFTSGQWYPVITGWTIIMVGFMVIHQYTKHLNYVKRCFAIFGMYIVAYMLTIFIFNILIDNPLFHFEYLLFVFLGVVIGGILIESYVKLYSLNSRLTDMYKLVEASESKYRLIAENTSDLIMVMDKGHEISYFSPSHEHVLGYTCCELEKFKLCKFIHPDDVTLFRRTISEMFISEKSQSMEFRLGHKAGHWIVFESQCMPVKGENQLIESIVIISRDISERRKAEEFLLQSEKLSIVGELAAGVAHEIRNPLTTIKGFVQLYKAENSSIVYNDLLLSELERIETITSELLSLGKPQAVQMTRLNLSDLVENTLDLLSPQALMNGIQFKLCAEESEIYITGEKNQLKQVFLNVLKNAMESMATGGEVYITIRKMADGECIISFQDQGIGIPEDILPRLGEPFYTLKEKGTGLGLMICNKIIKQHHGSITYQSKMNEGTLVEITLPLIE